MLLPDIKKFLKALNVTQVSKQGEWATCRCVLAPWTHAGGKDNNPSLGIKIAKSNSDTRYNCFTCGGGTSAGELLARLNMYSKNDPKPGVTFNFKAAQDVLSGLETQLAPIPDWEEFKPSEYAEFEEWPQWFVDSWTPAHYSIRALEYLKGRGVTEEDIIHAGLRFDPKKDMVVAPYYNMFGKLSGARGRSINPDCPKEYRHYDYTWNGVNNNHLVWYGEPELMYEKPIVIVEGQFDKLKVERVYPHVLAMLSSKVTEYKKNKLLYAPGVVLMTDDDQPGWQARDKLTAFLSSHSVPVVHFQYPPAPLGGDGSHVKQDPAKLSLEQLRAGLEPYLDLKTI